MATIGKSALKLETNLTQIPEIFQAMEKGVILDVWDGTALKQEMDERFHRTHETVLWKLQELHGVWSLRKWNEVRHSWELIDFRVTEQIEELILDKCGSHVLHNYWVCLDRFGLEYFK